MAFLRGWKVSARSDRFAVACLTAVLYACTGTGAEDPASVAAASAQAPDAPAGGPVQMQAPSAKRVAPAKVPPVIVGNLRIETLPWGKERGLEQNGGYIVAFDRTSGAELWTLKVYEVHYDPKLESDVQDVFIRSMSKSLFGQKLNITDELGRKYVVDVATRSVQAR